MDNGKIYRENTKKLQEARERLQAHLTEGDEEIGQQEVEAVWDGANARQEGGNHYKIMDLEPWDVVDTWPIEQQVGAHRHGALKYIMRMGSKDPDVQEIKKAAHYIQKLIEVLERGK